MIDIPSSTPPPAPRPSPWAIAAGLLALALLFHVSGGGWMILLLGLALMGPFFFQQRLESDSYLRWMVRIALIALIYQISQKEDESGNAASLAIGSVGLRSLFGQLYASEMVVQAWRRRNDNGYQSTLAVTLFSILVYLTACNVFNDQLVVLTTPVFMLLVAFALREWRSRTVKTTVAGVTEEDKRRRTMTGIQRVAAILLTLSIGFVTAQTVTVFKDNINNLGNEFLADQKMFENLGMSSQPELGSLFGLRGGTNRVLRVKNLVGDGHLRGATFSHYESGKWGPALNRYKFDPATSEDLSPVKPVYGKDLSHTRDDMTITRLVNMPLLFAPTNAVGLTTGGDQDARDRVDWVADAGGIMRNRAPAPYDYIVTMSSDSVAYQGPLCQPVLEKNLEQRTTYLQVPREDPVDGQPNPDTTYMRALAGRITKDAPTVPKKIAAITQYLLTHHHYSLTINVGSGDPVAGFLRERKDAHCEFFAASATLLLRYAGVPTRYVTGYLAHEAGREPGETIVRQRDAHAWCEAWVDGFGWVSVDATPGDGRPDEMVQEKVSPFQKLTEWFQDQFQKLKDKLADIPPAILNIIVIIAALLPLGLYGIFAAIKARRLRIKTAGAEFAYTISDETLAMLSGRFEQAFGKAGRPIAPERTYREQFPAITEDELTESGRQFARLYDVARFGGRRDRDTFDSLMALVGQIEQSAEKIVQEKRKR